MNNFYKILILVPFLILACKYKPIDEKILLQRIDSLDMNIYSSQGKKIYTIKSPESNYDRDSNTFNLKETTINLYNNEKIKYIINSDQSILSNNNKIIELNGNVKLITFDQDDDTLIANNFKWNINNSNYLLTGDVKFENKYIILISNKAILNSNNIVEFFNPVKYIIKNDNNENSYEINSENAFYNIETKSVSFESENKQVRSKIYF